MNIIFLLHSNPYYQNSASANRLIGLIQGLQHYPDCKLKFAITGGKQSKKELALPRNGILHNIQYTYISAFHSSSKWINRLHIYFLNSIVEICHAYRLKQFFKEEEASIIWIDDLECNNMRFLVKNQKWLKQNHKYFTEQSEFLDNHKFNKGNILQRRQADRRKKLFENRFFRLLDGMAIMTNHLKDHYLKFPLPQPTFLHLPMTVNLERFQGSYPLMNGFQKPYIAFVGVMNDAKDGVSILINAFASIAKDFSQFSLYLVGGWNYDTPYHLKLIMDLELESKVFWKNEYPRDKIPAIIKNADLLVLPRPDSHQAKGGFPTKLGEYLATGNPVCATIVGEIPNYLVDGESVYFANAGSIDSFANAMRRALSNPEEAKKIGANGLKVTEKHFNKDIQANILNDFLNENLKLKI